MNDNGALMKKKEGRNEGKTRRRRADVYGFEKQRITSPSENRQHVDPLWETECEVSETSSLWSEIHLKEAPV